MTPNRDIAHRRQLRIRLVCGILAVAAALGGLAAVPHSSGATASVSGLSSQLQAQRAAARNLSASVSGLSALIGRLAGQIAVIERHRTAVEGALSSDQATLATVGSELATQRVLRLRLLARVSRAMRILDAQLVSSYETRPTRPDQRGPDGPWILGPVGPVDLPARRQATAAGRHHRGPPGEDRGGVRCAEASASFSPTTRP